MSAGRGILDDVELATLERARGGDELAFRELTEPHRRELLVHCYRMLGSLTDAEDVLQETLLAAWRGLGGFEQRSSVRAWLYRIATNQCLNAIRSANRRAVPELRPPFDPPAPTARDEIAWLQPFPDTMLEGIPDTAPGPDVRYQSVESVRLAFVAALQRMPPRQTATLLLRDVLGFGADEVADMLGTSQTAIKGMLQRARAAVDQQRDRVPSTPEESDDVAKLFADAFVAADVDGIVALLTDDTWLSMPPAPHQYHGIAAITAFYHASFGYRAEHRRVAVLPTRANGQPAIATYVCEPGATEAVPGGIIVLDVVDGRITLMIRFHLEELYPVFGLPSSVLLD